MGTSNIYPRCPAKNILDFLVKIFFFKKSKIGHGGTTRNRIPSSTTVTEFSKTFPVFYKWPDLTDVQVVLTSTVFYSARCGAPQTTPADLGIWIYLFLGDLRAVPMRMHAFTELAKRKGCEICVWYSEHLPGEL